MKILLIFLLTFYLISGAKKDIKVTGYSGGGLLVRSWNSLHKDDAKYTQKLQNTTITRLKQDQWINDRRFTLFNNHYGDLIIYIRDVIPQDAGIYRIEVKGESSMNMTLTVQEDSCCKMSQIVMVNIGENANFSCEYSQNLTKDYKMLFKEGKDSTEIIYSTWKNKERFNISDGEQKNIFRVRISSVTPDDGGVYLCGVSQIQSSHTYTIINTVHLHIINKVGVSRLSGYSGGRMMFKCEHPQYKTRPKYICKESDGCSKRNNPGVQDEWVKNGDIYFYDDTRAGVLMVFFRELKAADAGTYRCGVNVSDYTETFTELQLNIRDVAKYLNSVTESAHPGEEVNIASQIPEEHRVNFCKEDVNHICFSTVTQMNGLSERNEERVFKVSISNVMVGDAGVYWCRAENRDTHLTSLSPTTDIQLNIINFSVIIIICVCVILVLIGVFILTVRKSRHKKQGHARTQSSAPQSPTIPNDELIYASVSFQKNKESLSDATVFFSKDQINSEYATIKHHTRLN